MNISDGEKLILLMLSELYESLDIEGEIDPEFIKSAIFSQNLWGIPWKYSGIPFESQDTPTMVKEVIDILDMWSFIEIAYRALSEEEKKKLENDAYPFGNNPTFRGFDGNNESEHMNIASFLINDLERFQEFKSRGLNAHMPTLEIYRRMLSEFNRIRSTLVSKPMSLEQLTTVLRKKINPKHSVTPYK